MALPGCPQGSAPGCYWDQLGDTSLGPGERKDMATTEQLYESLGCGTESHGFNLLACTQALRVSWHGKLWACMSPWGPTHGCPSAAHPSLPSKPWQLPTSGCTTLLGWTGQDWPDIGALGQGLPFQGMLWEGLGAKPGLVPVLSQDGAELGLAAGTTARREVWISRLGLSPSLRLCFYSQQD